MLITLLLFLLLVASVGFLFAEGIWANVLRLVNVIAAALLAMNNFEWLARTLEGWMPTYRYLLDFIAIWTMFVLFMVAFRMITDRVSRVRVRFLKIADQIGGGLLALVIGWVMVCFTLTTLHTAPLPEKFLAGSFTPGEPMFLGLSPDIDWLGFTQRASSGPFSCWTVNEFDPQAKFVPMYNTRRKKFETYVSSPKGGFRVPENQN